VVAWGSNEFGECDVPPLPPGVTYTEVSAGGYFEYLLLFAQYAGHSVALRSDGSVVAWGRDLHGQCSVPPLPTGVEYVEIAAGGLHTVARRSDGTVVTWGYDGEGQCRVPALPAGLEYVEIAAGTMHTLARRSDGSVVAWGQNGVGQCSVPALPAGLTYVEIAAGEYHSLAQRSDGSVVAWGDNSLGQCNVPGLPPGLSYVEIAAGVQYSVARRSDGSVVAWGDNSHGQCDVPAAPAGLGYVEIDASGVSTTARVGQSGMFTRLGPGCRGSRPPARLVPLDTPRIGDVMDITLFELPQDVAWMILGLSSTHSPIGPLPFDLGVIGMSGCSLRVSGDLGVPVAGARSQARFTVPIPDLLMLVGGVFHLQAFVPDSTSGNVLGAVMSDAMTVTVGR
jgi:hypothetical protein